MHKHNDLSLICPECGKSLETKRKMYRHLKSHNYQEKVKDGEIKERECTICNQMFPSNIYQTHMFKFHDQSVFFCDICGSKFRSRLALQRHIDVVHTKLWESQLLYHRYSRKSCLLKNLPFLIFSGFS